MTSTNSLKADRATAVGAPSFSVGPMRLDQRDQIIDCLTRNFPTRSRLYWKHGFQRISQWTHEQDFPTFGIVLEVDRKVVGVVFQIFSRHERGGQTYMRCNLSSWCVDEEYRAYAFSLHNAAVKAKDVTYLNVTPATHTLPFITALGFRAVSNGQMLMLPALGFSRQRSRVVAYVEGDARASLLSGFERRLLADHAAMGCTSVICLREGRATPFVFRPHKIFSGRLPSAHLIYCRDLEDFRQSSAALGRFLLLRFGPFVVINVDAPLPGIGRFSPRKQPRFFKGPATPSPGDLAYTELTFLEP